MSENQVINNTQTQTQNNPVEEKKKLMNKMKDKYDATSNEMILLVCGIAYIIKSIVDNSVMYSYSSGSLRGYCGFNLFFYVPLFFVFIIIIKLKPEYIEHLIIFIILFVIIANTVYIAYCKDENVSNETTKGYIAYSNFLNNIFYMGMLISYFFIDKKQSCSNAVKILEQANQNVKAQSNEQLNEPPNGQIGGKRKSRTKKTTPKKRKYKKRS